MDFVKVAEKWQKKWESKKVHQADVKEKKKYFVTFPYPYINGEPHIGHAYTFVKADILARFKRMQGYNVLFPQGWHATGQPLYANWTKLANGDKEAEEMYRKAGATDKDIEKIKKDIKNAVEFWVKKWREGFNSMSISVDWRREFITTELNPYYSKFVEWQFRKLKDMGLVVQKEHPVVWCPKCKSTTGDHDRLKGEGETPVEYILIKFRYNDMILPAATFRPETVYGVTNMWINPKVEYVIAEVGKEKWIVSKEAFEKLKLQKEVKQVGKVNGSELIGKSCTNPVTKEDVPILQAEFVDPNNGTGVVMSVPAHAPYDYIALKDIGMLDKVKIKSIINTPGLGEVPAKDIIEEMGIENQNDPKLETATKELYKKEFHMGRLKDNCGLYSGKKVSDCKEDLSEAFKKEGIADSLWELTGEVICRCGTRCVIKIVKNQWFIKYSDKYWKEKTRSCLKNLTTWPKEVKGILEEGISWVRDKACTRTTGLGTHLPWDKKWIIESLSDSTIYPAFYAIDYILKTIDENKVDDKLFDYVLLGEGSIDEFDDDIKDKIIKMRKEFEYWYPVDARISAKDLLKNHFLFYLFNHTAIFPKDKWPLGIGANGVIKVGESKMSKSLGNFRTLSDVAKQYGPDIVRIALAGAGEGLEDAIWDDRAPLGYKSRLEYIESIVEKMDSIGETERQIDKYLISKMQTIIRDVVKHYENLETRSAVQKSIYEATNDLKWYFQRGGNNRAVVKYALETIIKLLTPVVPHWAEELWHKLNNKKLVVTERFPREDIRKINTAAERGEELVKNVADDIRHIIKITGKKPSKIKIITSPAWKYYVYDMFLVLHKEEGIKDVKKLIDRILKRTEIKPHAKEVAMIVANLIKKSVIPLDRDQEIITLNDAKDYFKSQFKCEVEIESGDESKEEKASKALPMKPAIILI